MSEATLAPQAAPATSNPVPPVDLDAYCARIGYSGPREPTLETLRALQALHAAAIPFEAIDVQLDRGIDLAPAAIDAKLIGGRRGGYCFEQNNLFMRVLAAVGFSVEGLMGRVRWIAPGRRAAAATDPHGLARAHRRRAVARRRRLRELYADGAFASFDRRAAADRT